MLERILRYSVERRGLVVLAVLVAAMFGARALVDLPIDAVPDITNRQVQVNAVAPSLSPTEVEKQVTFPSRPRSQESRALTTPAPSRETHSHR